MGRILAGCWRWAAAAMLAAGLLVPAAHAQTSGKTIQFIPEADLRSLDPIWTTAYITRNHGYMVYDTLFALDEHFKPQPQMVDTLDSERRQAHLHFYAARQAQIPRRHAGALGRLHRLAGALDEARRARPGDGAVGRRDEGEGRPTFSIMLEEAFPAAAGRHRQALEQRALHHAGARRQDRRQHPDHRYRPAPARSNSSRTNGFPATRRSTSAIPITCRAASSRAGPPAARSSRSTASNGSTSPIPPPPPTRWRRRGRLVAAAAAGPGAAAAENNRT